MKQQLSSDVISPMAEHTLDRRRARVAGILFLIAVTASITGGTMIQSVLDQPDAHALLLDESGMLISGVWLEVINALAVIGIAAAFWTPLSRTHPSATAGYLGVRVLEAAACAAAALLPITLIALAEQGNASADSVTLLSTLRSGLVGNAVPVLFGFGAAILYVLLYRTALVPRYISIWGLIGALGIIANVVIAIPALLPFLALPMITNELYLGMYLIVRGFRQGQAGRENSLHS